MLGLGHMLCTDLLTRAPCLQGGISPATRPMTGAGRPLTGFARPGTGSTHPGTGGVEAAFQGGRPGTSRPVTSGGRCAGAWARTSAGALPRTHWGTRSSPRLHEPPARRHAEPYLPSHSVLIKGALGLPRHCLPSAACSHAGLVCHVAQLLRCAHVCVPGHGIPRA